MKPSLPSDPFKKLTRFDYFWDIEDMFDRFNRPMPTPSPPKETSAWAWADVVKSDGKSRKQRAA